MSLLFITLFVLNSASASVKCGSPSPHWKGCKSDSDCAVGFNECGFKTGFNKKSLDKVRKYNQCVGPYIDCVTPDENHLNTPFEAICKSGKCILVQYKNTLNDNSK